MPPIRIVVPKVIEHRGVRSRVVGQGLSAVQVAAPAPAVRLGPELALKLHEAPDLGAVGAPVGLDAGGQFADGGQVDGKQLRALLQRSRNRPTQIRVVPSPHGSSVSNMCLRRIENVTCHDRSTVWRSSNEVLPLARRGATTTYLTALPPFRMVSATVLEKGIVDKEW
jgi:hypothetical protein